MTSIALYVEGGGRSEHGKAALRQGFDELLAKQKKATRARGWRWKTVLCGSRNAAVDAFQNATSRRTAEIVLLLVDAEGSVADSTPSGRVAHLREMDHWDLREADGSCIHLMTQCMESWVVADGDVLAKYYGKGFRADVLPQRPELDGEPKAAVLAKLDRATKGTSKGTYGKIKHASDLLKRVRPTVVHSRCRSFQALTRCLDDLIERQ